MKITLFSYCKEILLLVVYLSVHNWTLSSAGERFLHTEEVTGSIPVVSTSE